MKCVYLFLLLSAILRLSAAGGKSKPEWPKKATVHFAANDAAILFLNGKPKAYVSRWSAFRKVQLRVKKGDIIAFKATNRKDSYGFIANIRIGKKNFPTGSKYWRSTHGGLKIAGWMRKKKGFCWHRPMLVPSNRFRRCTGFPHRFRARYVWACHSSPGVRTVSLLRFVVDGDGCGRKPVSDSHVSPTPTPSRTPTPSPSTAKTLIDGAGDEDSRTSCKCEEVDNSNGMCYYFLEPLARSGACISRPCAKGYQCKEDGSMVCIKKYVLEKVIPLLPDTQNCMIVKTRDPVWIPYSKQ